MERDGVKLDAPLRLSPWSGRKGEGVCHGMGHGLPDSRPCEQTLSLLR